MDKLIKILRLGTPERKLTNFKIFGRTLEALMCNSPVGIELPFIVTRLCSYIRSKGFDHEDIFSSYLGSNDNAELLKLKAEFNLYGDADLEKADISAVEELLISFLEKMSDPVIPRHLTERFVEIREVYKNDLQTYVSKLKDTMNNLPRNNYNLLQYLIKFLVQVSGDVSNKITPVDLAGVFAPTIFRCPASLYPTVSEIISDVMEHHAAVLDDRNPVFKVPWFHGYISHRQANKLLKKKGDFLVRQKKCTGTNEKYVLSVKWYWTRHYRIQYKLGGWQLKNTFKSFETIPELINYHFNTGVPVLGIAKLKRAVPHNEKISVEESVAPEGVPEQTEASSVQLSSSGLALDVAHQ